MTNNCPCFLIVRRKMSFYFYHLSLMLYHAVLLLRRLEKILIRVGIPNARNNPCSQPGIFMMYEETVEEISDA